MNPFLSNTKLFKCLEKGFSKLLAGNFSLVNLSFKNFYFGNCEKDMSAILDLFIQVKNVNPLMSFGLYGTQQNINQIDLKIMWNKISEMLIKSRKLERFSINNVNLSPENCKVLSDGIVRNKSLVLFYMGGKFAASTNKLS